MLPAIVALITDAVSGEARAIQRTYLSPATWDKASVEPNRMMLGPTRGGVVRLAEAIDHVLIGEGVETSLSVMQACGTPAWAALSASGMRVLNLPEEIKFVTLLADGDQVGKSAAEAAAHRWTQQGKKVRIAEAPRGKDFNDILKKPAPTGEIKQ